jgi:hypothetical protein
MARKVYKFQDVREGLGWQEMLLPVGSIPIHWDAEKYCLWVELDPDQTDKEMMRFAIVGTGQDIPEDAEHVVTLSGSALVWHLYREPERVFRFHVTNPVSAPGGSSAL